MSNINGSRMWVPPFFIYLALITIGLFSRAAGLVEPDVAMSIERWTRHAYRRFVLTRLLLLCNRDVLALSVLIPFKCSVCEMTCRLVRTLSLADQTPFSQHHSH